MEHFYLTIFANFVFMKKNNWLSYLVKDEYHTILNKLRLLRIEKGITQHQVGEKLGINDNAYSKLENGHTKLDLERLIFILKVLDISLKDFFENFKEFKEK